MTLYRGSVYKTFLIDRLACGFDDDMIISEFTDVYGTDITSEDISKISTGCEEEIKEREVQLLNDIDELAPDIVIRINSMSREMERILKELKDTKDYRTMVATMGTWLKSMEMLGRLLGKFQEKAQNVTQTINYIELANANENQFEKWLEKKNKKELIAYQ